jgi:hypothetical protein
MRKKLHLRKSSKCLAMLDTYLDFLFLFFYHVSLRKALHTPYSLYIGRFFSHF